MQTIQKKHFFFPFSYKFPWFVMSGFLGLTNISVWGQSSNPINQDLLPDLKTQQRDEQKRSDKFNQKNNIKGTSLKLSPIQVKGKSDPILSYTKIDPDKDYSSQGKSRVLTTTTTFKTFRDKQIDSLEDYSRRVDAAINYNSNNYSINMRGLDQSRLLTTIDGIRMMWANDGAFASAFTTQQGGLSTFDFNSLGGMDVIKSADSSFFGTGSLGGVVALRTFNPEDILKSGQKFGGITKTTYDGVSASALLNQIFATRYKNTLFLLEGGYSNGSETGNMGHTGGYGNTRTKHNPASYDQGSFVGKVIHYFSGGHRLGITGEWVDRNVDEHTLTSQRVKEEFYRTQSKNQRSRFSVHYDYKAKDPAKDLFGEGQFIAYWQDNNVITNISDRYDLMPKRDSWQKLDMDVQSYGVVGHATMNVFTSSIHHAITYGGEAYLTDTSQYQSGWNATKNPFLHNNFSDMPNVHGTDLGAILQDRIGIGKNEWLHITSGVRFDYFKRDPHNTSKYQNNPIYNGLPKGASGSRYSPKILVEARIIHQLVAYAQYSQSYRAPSANEEYLSYGTPPMYQVTGNPDLKAETGRGWEVGLKYGNSRRGFNIAFYDNYYRNYIDMIGINPCTGTQMCFGYDNLSRVRIYGTEASMNWEFDPNWHTWASFAYAHGRNTDINYALSSIAPFRGIIGFGYKTDNWGTDLSSTFAIARDNAKFLNNTGVLSKQWNTPGYVVFDLTGWYRPSFYRPLRFQFGMYNMFDKKYYNASSLPVGQSSRSLQKAYFSQPGRYFKVTARIDF